MENKVKSVKSLQYYMRMIHRVLGYLAVGLVLVYAWSGITLIYRTGDFMKRSTTVEQSLDSNLTPSELGAILKIKNFKVSQEDEQTIVFGDGEYDKTTGKVVYVKKDVVAPFNKFIDLHKMSEAKNPAIAIIATIFGAILFLLALTSLFMYKPSSKQFNANMLYLGIGIAGAILLIIFA